MMTLRLKARYRVWKAKRKLEKSGYSSWRAYRHNRDSDVCPYADKVSDFYHGYTYVSTFECGIAHYAFQCLYNYGPGGVRYGYEDMRDWCETKCRFKYRMDIHRVFKQTGIGINNDLHEDWWFNDIGGSDVIYFAFQNEQDYMMFRLRWE